MADTIIEIEGGMFDSTEVTEVANGYPVGNKAVGSDFFAKMIGTLYSNGIAGSGDELRVTAGSGMTLALLPGAAWINGYMAWNRETLRLPITAGVNYTVCLRLDLTEGTTSILCVENPAEGEYPMRGETVHDLVLARVNVPGGAVNAAEAEIEDCRFDAALCGVVKSAVEGLDVIGFAADAGMLGGYGANAYLKRSGGTMTGKLRAASDGTGVSAVRNISYGTALPDNLEEGEIFILIS